MPNITYTDDPNGDGVDGLTPDLLHAGDTVPAGITLADADGNALNAGDTVPPGHVIHYVTDTAGALVSENAFDVGGCCVTTELHDSGNDNAKVIAIVEVVGGVVGSPTYLNALDFTPFTGNIADLVNNAADASFLLRGGDVTSIAGLVDAVGNTLPFGATVPTDTVIWYTVRGTSVLRQNAFSIASSESFMLRGGDTTSIVGLQDADGNVLAVGATIPDGQLIHYVTDEAGSLVRQNAYSATASSESFLLAPGDSTAIDGLLDADGDALANGGTVPAGQVIHYVSDATGALVRQNAFQFDCVIDADAGGAAWEAGNAAYVDPATIDLWCRVRVVNTPTGTAIFYRGIAANGDPQWRQI